MRSFSGTEGAQRIGTTSGRDHDGVLGSRKIRA